MMTMTLTVSIQEHLIVCALTNGIAGVRRWGSSTSTRAVPVGELIQSRAGQLAAMLRYIMLCAPCPKPSVARSCARWRTKRVAALATP